MNFYLFFLQYDALCFEARDKSLKHALKARLPSGSPIATIELMISNYHAFFYQAATSKTLGGGQKLFRIPNCGPTLVSVDYRRAMIKAAPHRF